MAKTISTPTLVASTDPKEDSATRFRRLANYRSKKAISAIRQLGQLGKPEYKKTEDEISKLESALLTEVRAAISSLRSGKSDLGDII